jgi:hypothetical protein
MMCRSFNGSYVCSTCHEHWSKQVCYYVIRMQVWIFKILFIFILPFPISLRIFCLLQVNCQFFPFLSILSIFSISIYFVHYLFYLFYLFFIISILYMLSTIINYQIFLLWLLQVISLWFLWILNTCFGVMPTIKWAKPNSFVLFKKVRTWNWKLRWYATIAKTL